MRLISGLVCLLLSTSPSYATDHHWDVKRGTNDVTISKNGIHITPKKTTAIESASESLQLGMLAEGSWRIGFLVRTAYPVSGSMSVQLLRHGDKLAWMGADAVYKAMSGFIGADSSVMPYTAPCDGNWHHFEYRGDGKRISISCDGRQLGTSEVVGMPDVLRVESRSCEMWLKDVEADTFPKETPANGIQTLDHLVEDYNDTLIHIQEENAAWHNDSDACNTYLYLIGVAFTEEQVVSDRISFDACMDSLKMHTAKQETLTDKAFGMYQTITSLHDFSAQFHSTHLCLPEVEMITTNPEARRLRFIERR